MFDSLRLGFQPTYPVPQPFDWTNIVLDPGSSLGSQDELPDLKTEFHDPFATGLPLPTPQLQSSQSISPLDDVPPISLHPSPMNDFESSLQAPSLGQFPVYDDASAFLSNSLHNPNPGSIGCMFPRLSLDDQNIGVVARSSSTGTNQIRGEPANDL
jgi:hypothetical protein